MALEVSGGGHKIEATAEIYDIKNDKFIPIKSQLNVPRMGHTASLLENGHVLIVGGNKSGNEIEGLDSMEVYNPESQTFTLLNSTLCSYRHGHRVISLDNKRLLCIGGDVSGYDTNSGSTSGSSSKSGSTSGSKSTSGSTSGSSSKSGSTSGSKSTSGSASGSDSQSGNTPVAAKKTGGTAVEIITY